MARWPALPCSFGLAVTPTSDYYVDGFRDLLEAPGVRVTRIVVPGEEDLAEWAKSCLEVDEYEPLGPANPYRGWSPGRSVVVRITHLVTSSHPLPGCMDRWVLVWKKFLVCAWNLLQHRSLPTRKARMMVVHETDGWDHRWVRVVASTLNASWASLSSLEQCARIREWSFRVIAEHERNQVRLAVAAVFLDEPIRVLSLIERGQRAAV